MAELFTHSATWTLQNTHIAEGFFFRTLTKENCPENVVGNREYSTTEVITILGDWEVFGEIEEIQVCLECEHNM